MKKQLILAILSLLGSANAVGMEASLKAEENTEHAFLENLKNGNLEHVKRYLDQSNRLVNQPFTDQGLDPKLVNERITPLMIAAYNGHVELVSYLIKEKKAKADLLSHKGDNALTLSLCENHPNQLKILRLLLEDGNIGFPGQMLAQVGHNGLTPLQNACQLGQLESVQYLVEKMESISEIMNGKSIFDPHITGTVTLSIAKARNHTSIVNYLVSKGVPHLSSENRPQILQNIFHNPHANRLLNLDHFDLIAYTTLPINPSVTIPSFGNGGTLHIFQPRVFQQNGTKEECTEAKLKHAAEKLGGTPKMHKETSPIFGGTCSYHAMKNALLGLMLLEDYDRFSAAQESNSKEVLQKSEFVNADITNLTALKTPQFDSEQFMETLHAKICVLNNATQAFTQPEAVALQQGADNHSMLIAREKFDAAYRKQMQERHNQELANISSKISFIDDQTIRMFIFNCRMKTDSFTSLKDQELLSQIALFRKSSKYRHAFHISLNTGELNGYGQSIGKNRMHAITVILDKRGSHVNALVFESNNLASYAIKEILFDFLALFIDESKKTMHANECESHAALANDPFDLNRANIPTSVCNAESLLNNYQQRESLCLASKKREDIAEALFCLSQLQYLQNILDASSSKKSLEKLEALFKKYSINSDILRAREIKLFTLLQKIEDKELNERMLNFIIQKDVPRLIEAIKVGANPNILSIQMAALHSIAQFIVALK